MVLGISQLSAGSLLVICMTSTRFRLDLLLHTGVAHLYKLGHHLMLSKCVLAMIGKLDDTTN